MSYAPFRKHQTPWNSTAIISPEQIAEDLAELAKVSKCIRTYSVENGLDKVPELASRVGLKVILGIWLGRDRAKNAQLIDTALSAAEQHRDVVTALMVGSEVLLRGEMLASDLRKIILSVKARTSIPVSYADVWEFWLRYQELSDAVDFVTIHILPYWEDLPVRAEDAAAHVDDIRRQVALAFPGKEILIGEAGWPSKGRMRDGARPSRINQARFISGLLDRSRQQNYRVNLFEAYDEPWKRQWEGTVGAHWGLFDGETRALKYPPGIAISNYPFWKLQLGFGLVLSIAVFAVAFWTARAPAVIARSGGVGGGSDLRDNRRRAAGVERGAVALRELRYRRPADAQPVAGCGNHGFAVVIQRRDVRTRAADIHGIDAPAGAQNPAAGRPWLWEWR